MVLVEVELVNVDDICSVVVVVGGLVVVGDGLVVGGGELVVVAAAGATVVVFIVDGTDGDGAIAPEKEEGTEMLGVGVGVGEIATV